MQNIQSKFTAVTLVAIAGLMSSASYAQMMAPGGGMTPPSSDGGTGGGNSCDVTDASGLLHTYTQVNGVIYDCPWYSDGNGGFTSGTPFGGGCTEVTSAPCSLDNANFRPIGTFNGQVIAEPVD